MGRLEACAMFAAAAAGCGRVAFDGASDAMTDAQNFGAGCVVGFHFEEPAWTGAPGEVIDDCGGDQSGSITGGAKRVDDDVRGRVADFNTTTDDCVVIPDQIKLRLTGAATMSAWVFPTALDAVTPYGIIAKRTNDSSEVAYAMFAWTGNHVWVDIDEENDEVEGVRALANGRWQQVTVVYDGTRAASERVQIYIDGVLDKTGAESSATITQYASSLHVGCLPQTPPTANQQSFRGKLDDVGIWNRAFTSAEVEDWYQATK